jgi:hypothetical protein
MNNIINNIFVFDKLYTLFHVEAARVYKLIDINKKRVHRLTTTVIVDRKAKIRSIGHDRKIRWI